MGLRVYMKSGNNYYVDVSEYLYDEVYEQLTDAILYGDNYSIDAHGKTYFFKGVDKEGLFKSLYASWQSLLKICHYVMLFTFVKVGKMQGDARLSMKLLKYMALRLFTECNHV